MATERTDQATGRELIGTFRFWNEARAFMRGIDGTAVTVARKGFWHREAFLRELNTCREISRVRCAFVLQMLANSEFWIGWWEHTFLYRLWVHAKLLYTWVYLWKWESTNRGTDWKMGCSDLIGASIFKYYNKFFSWRFETWKYFARWSSRFKIKRFRFSAHERLVR